MTRGNKPRIQYNPVFRDSSSNYPFEDIFLYDNHTTSNYKEQPNFNKPQLSYDHEKEKENEKDNPGCFYSFNKIIIWIGSYFIDAK
jgi:hypothetical protein